MDRRDFVTRLAALAAASWLQACRREEAKAPPPNADPKAKMAIGSGGDLPAPESKSFSAAEAKTLQAMLARLLPAGIGRDDAPGAIEAGVFGYVDREVAKPAFAGIGRELARGAAALDAAARKQLGGKAFHEAPAKDQDALLAKVQTGKAALRLPAGGRFNGPRFFELALTLGLEGYFGAPSHGGNRDMVTWKHYGIPWAAGHGGH